VLWCSWFRWYSWAEPGPDQLKDRHTGAVLTQTKDGPADETGPAGVVVPFRRREIEVQVPDAPPMLTPSVATALLRLLLNVQERNQRERAA
jgi:hypothetical protein